MTHRVIFRRRYNASRLRTVYIYILEYFRLDLVRLEFLLSGPCRRGPVPNEGVAGFFFLLVRPINDVYLKVAINTSQMTDAAKKPAASVRLFPPQGSPNPLGSTVRKGPRISADRREINVAIHQKLLFFISRRKNRSGQNPLVSDCPLIPRFDLLLLAISCRVLRMLYLHFNDPICLFSPRHDRNKTQIGCGQKLHKWVNMTFSTCF